VIWKRRVKGVKLEQRLEERTGKSVGGEADKK
jgi:hypothetical protein